jgi:hypothetical protein
MVSTYASETNKNGEYKLNDSKIEGLFEQSDDITFVGDMASILLPAQQKVKGEDIQLVAGIVALASWLLAVGILVPIHRLILGTGNQAGKIIALYCVTLGGCGFITLIDGIMLVMDGSGSRYIDNPKFIMWQ